MTSKHKIPNYYENIPKDLLTETDNPNYDLHLLKLPFRMVVVAPSGSGKSNFITHILHQFCNKRGTFADIVIVTRNKDEPLYNYLSQKSEGLIQVLEGMHSLPKLDNMDKKKNHLVVVDDLVLDKNQGGICEYYIRARKLNCSVIYLSQKFYAIPQIIRGNCNYFVLLKLTGKREIKLILSEFSLGVNEEQLMDLYQQATSEKFQPLIVDLDAPLDTKFRRGLLEFLEPRV